MIVIDVVPAVVTVDVKPSSAHGDSRVSITTLGDEEVVAEQDSAGNDVKTGLDESKRETRE